jgi:hypothetical protein
MRLETDAGIGTGTGIGKGKGTGPSKDGCIDSIGPI